MRSRSLALALALTLGAGSVFAMNRPLEAASFMKAAIKGDTTEIMLSRLAEQRASDPRVRQFAGQLASGHAQWRKRADALARRLGAATPMKPNAAGDAERAQLIGLSGKAFDRAYLTDMILNHAHTIAVSKLEARTSNKASSFAAASVPALERYLNEAKALRQSVG